MDERLSQISGVRPGRLRRIDLPNVARAIVLHSSGGTAVTRRFHGGLECVLFTGAVTVCVLASDWDRVLPYLRDGFFRSAVYPTPRVGALNPVMGDPSLEASPYRALYDRVLTTLQELFSEPERL